jgi:MSHA biogenesis protein MshL
MSNQPLQLAVAIIAAALLAGCAPEYHNRRAEAGAEAGKLVQDALEPRKSEEPALIEQREDTIRTRAILPSAEAGDVSVTAAGVPVGNLLTSLAREHDYSVMYAEGVNAARPVTIELRNLTVQAALRRVALAAGYVAVMDAGARTVTVADSASYTFRLPLHVMQRLEASFTVGGNPIAGQTTAISPTSTPGGGTGITAGVPGTGGANGESGSALQATFTVTGRYQTDAPGLRAFLQQLAGRNADVQLMPDLGMITVRSNAAALARVGNFLNRFSANAMRRVEIEASIVEVTLTDEFQYGIQWEKVLSGRTKGTVKLGDTTLVTGSPTVDLNLSRSGITAILQALQSYTTVRVISQPKVMAMNNTPAVIFDGQQLPYLGSIATTTIPGAGGASTTTAGSASFAVDGVTLSIQPDILSDSEVQLTIVPVLSRVQQFQTFDLGGGSKITAPVQRSNQSLMQVVAETGRTLIIGGIRSTVGNAQKNGIPGVVDTRVVGDVLSGRSVDNQAREVVILLRARVVAGGAYDALFAEAI